MSVSRNNAVSRLASAHLSGSGTLVLASGEGTRFGSPTADAPIRVTVAARSTLVNGQIAPTSTQTIFDCTARANDTLSGLTVVEGTSDQNFGRNDPVASLITAGMLSDVQGSVEGKADDDAVVKLTGAQAIGGVKTFGDDLEFEGVSHCRLTPTTNFYERSYKKESDDLRPADVTFNYSCASFANMGGTTWNNVYDFGWNNNSGSAHVAGHFVFRDAWEDNYEASAGVFQTERHVGAVYNTATGEELRPLTMSVITSTSPFMSVIVLNTSQLYVFTEDHAATLLTILQSGNDYAFTTPAFALTENLTDSSFSTGGDGLTNTVNFNGATDTVNFKINSTIKWALHASSDESFSISTGSGQAVFFGQNLSATFRGTNLIQFGGTLPTYARWINSSSTGSAGDYGWLIGANGSGVDGTLLLRHTSSGVFPFRVDNTSFKTSVPVYVGATAVGSAAARLEAKALDASSNIFALYTSAGVVKLVSGPDGTTTFSCPVVFADGTNLALGTTTGTKIGTASTEKLGFFGATPIVRPTMGAATAGGTYGATEQAMLQAVYNALRNFGLGS